MKDLELDLKQKKFKVLHAILHNLHLEFIGFANPS
jgi:hypothetical protein